MTAAMAVTAYPSKQAFDFFLLLKSFTFFNYIHNVQTMHKNSQNVMYLLIKSTYSHLKRQLLRTIGSNSPEN